MNSRYGRRVLLSMLGGAIWILLAFSPTANAVVEVGKFQNGQILTISDGGGVFGLPDAASQVTLGLDPADPATLIITSSSGVAINPGTVCTFAGATSVRCPVAGIRLVSGGLRAFNDSFRVVPGGLPRTITLEVLGEAGNDLLVGRNPNSAKADLLSGGTGNDIMRGLGGRDILDGGGGNDRANAGPGKDQLVGRGGNDRLDGGPGDDLGKGGKGKDRFKGVERILSQ
jgi:hypothetical protein